MSLDENTRRLLGRLDSPARNALEAAALMARSRRHKHVGVCHWASAIVDADIDEVLSLCDASGVSRDEIGAALDAQLDATRGDWPGQPAFDGGFKILLDRAWLFASTERKSPRIHALDILVTLARESELHADIGEDAARRLTPLAKFEPGEPAAAGGAAPAQGASEGEEALAAYTIDLTQKARDGKIDPVIGRDGEIRQMIDILIRRRQNNPILTGEAGVGKTAVVEGFAARIAEGQVPDALKGVTVRTLDLTLLQAGASMRGEFEKRLTAIVSAVKDAETPIILFIDEAHQLVGAGGQAGQQDAANIIKPALARGELRTIAATTWSEYKQYFEKDAALTRRFQVVHVKEPDEDTAVAILRALVDLLERHHNVLILEEAVLEAVRLSSRYIAGRQLPDKAVSLLDTACARTAMGQAATPASLQTLYHDARLLETALGIAEREHLESAARADDIAALLARRQEMEAEAERLEGRWAREKEIIQQIADLRLRLLDASARDEGVDALRQDLARANDMLAEAQADGALMRPAVDAGVLAEVVEEWTGIPVGRMVADEIEAIVSLHTAMEQRVIGQSHALAQITKSVQIGRAGLGAPEKPIGVFLLAGTSGVGKTETALALAELLFGSDQSLLTINMTEFKEPHKVSLLMGSPPGYVGYGEGGLLTEAVRRRPYSVVLLDEMEKAHESVQDVFFQVFDKGAMKDSEGRDVDFRNTVILMTSNAGTGAIANVLDSGADMPGPDELLDVMQAELQSFFKPAFLGRCTIIPYLPLEEPVLRKIAALQINKIKRRVQSHYGAELDVAPAVIDHIVERSRDPDTGARVIERLLSREILPLLSVELLDRVHKDGAAVTKINLMFSSDAGYSVTVV